MFIVRRQDIHPRGGSSYLIEASKDYGTKYRWSKISRKQAVTFNTKRSASTWATKMGGDVVEVIG